MSKNEYGVYADLKDLIKLEHKARGFQFLPRQPIDSLLAGRNTSRLRGRGLDFEELRKYLPGDDIRTIDWKVTNRTRMPYVRVYGEEKERTVFFIVDQRLSMFFGTQRAMKSVTAAEVMALGAWKVIESTDRVGGIIFNDSDITEVRPQRSRKAVMQLIGLTVKKNRELGVNKDIVEDRDMLNNVLRRVSNYRLHDALFCIISDFNGLSPDTHKSIKNITAHNDVILTPIYDPIAKQLPQEDYFLRVSDGEQDIELNLSEKKLAGKIPGIFQGRMKSLTEELNKFGVPVLPIDTVMEVDKQLRALLGGEERKKFKGKSNSYAGVR